MDEIKMLHELDRRSARPSLGGVDVTADVLATLRRGEESRSAVPLLMTLAATGCSLAVVLGFLAQQAFAATQDPLGSLLSPFMIGL